MEILPDSDNQFCYSQCTKVDPQKNILINHADYMINYNIGTKYADWVAYKINKQKLLGMNKARVWRSPPNLPPKIAMVPADYTDAPLVCNYDRGHQAPLADFGGSVNWESVNYLSNITPQKAELNRGSWHYLESEIRQLGKITSAQLYVLTGPYYTDKPMCNLPHARIKNRVPNGY